MNSVKLYGRLVKDPEIRSSGEGKSVASFTVACQRKYKDKDGNYSADFVNCVAFGKTAEILEKHFSKGMPIIVDGRINTGSYTNKDGNKVYTTNVAVDSVEFVGSKGENSGGSGNKSGVSDDGFLNIPDTVDDVPFVN